MAGGVGGREGGDGGTQYSPRRPEGGTPLSEGGRGAVPPSATSPWFSNHDTGIAAPPSSATVGVHETASTQPQAIQTHGPPGGRAKQMRSFCLTTPFSDYRGEKMEGETEGRGDCGAEYSPRRFAPPPSRRGEMSLRTGELLFKTEREPVEGLPLGRNGSGITS